MDGRGRQEDASGAREREVSPERLRERLRKRALNLINFAPRTEEELRDRLAEKSWARGQSELIDSVVAEFVGRGLLGGEGHERALRDRLFAYATDLLARAPRTERDLRARLSRPKWSRPEHVEDVLSALVRYGYVDDEAYARRYAESRAASGRSGARRIRLELRAKGVTDRDTIERAVAQAVENTPEADAVDALIAKRMRTRDPSDLGELRRMRDFLLRRGFDPETVRERIARLSRAVSDET